MNEKTVIYVQYDGKQWCAMGILDSTVVGLESGDSPEDAMANLRITTDAT